MQYNGTDRQLSADRGAPSLEKAQPDSLHPLFTFLPLQRTLPRQSDSGYSPPTPTTPLLTAAQHFAERPRRQPGVAAPVVAVAVPAR